VFPNVTIAAVGGGTINLPLDLAGSYGVVLLFRGAWCPYCNAQIAAFSRAHEALAKLCVKVIALSADDEIASSALVNKYGVRFPVGHSADVDSVAAVTGAYTSENPKYLQSTGFVLDPVGHVITAVYSSDAIGRLVPEDVAGLVQYVKSHS